MGRPCTPGAFLKCAKTLSNVDAEGEATGITYYNRSVERARTNYDIAQHFASNLVYEESFGKGRHWMNKGGIADKALGGWHVTSGFKCFRRAPPFTVTFSGSPNKYLPGASRPNIPTTNAEAQVQTGATAPDFCLCRQQPARSRA